MKKRKQAARRMKVPEAVAQCATWRQFRDTPYMVADDGRVYNTRTRRLVGYESAAGNASHYAYVTLGRNTHMSVACMVWEACNGAPVPKGQDVKHVNGDRGDCTLRNLRLADRSTNKLMCNVAYNATGYRGVHRVKNRRGEHVGYVARCAVRRRHTFESPRCETAAEAAMFRDRWLMEQTIFEVTPWTVNFPRVWFTAEQLAAAGWSKERAPDYRNIVQRPKAKGGIHA